MREVDWCNRSYETDFVYARTYELLTFPGKLYDGSWESHVWTCNLTGTRKDYGGHTIERWQVVEVAYGDLDGDGTEDVAVSFDYLWIPCGGFVDRGPRPREITYIQVMTVRAGDVVALAPRIEARHLSRSENGDGLSIVDGEVRRTFTRGDRTCDESWRVERGTTTPLRASCGW